MKLLQFLFLSFSLFQNLPLKLMSRVLTIKNTGIINEQVLTSY